MAHFEEESVWVTRMFLVRGCHLGAGGDAGSLLSFPLVDP